MEYQFEHSPFLSGLLEQASNNTEEGISISSMTLPDQPLIYLNAGFERLTGYKKEDAIGKNCRFLQGEKTDPESVKKIRKAIKRGEACTVELLNYRKDGSVFWNRLSISPLRNEEDVITHYVGIQSDITELKQTKEELEQANIELREFQSLINKELEQAKLAQEFLLPELPENSKIGMAAKFVPMAQIGGDFYDVVKIDSDVYGILIADVTGHGIPAALLTFMSSTAFKNIAPGNRSSQAVISQTNERLYSKMPDDSFLTLFYAVFDSGNYQLTFTQAGHLPAILIKKNDNEILCLETKDPLVGIFHTEEVQFREQSIVLDPGDRLILYTDAIIETRDAQGDHLGIDGLIKFFEENQGKGLQELLNDVYEYGLVRSGHSVFEDDFTMVAMEVIS